MNTLNTFEGSLWNGDNIIRQDYAKHHRDIYNTLQLRSTLRAGEFAWPGGYQLAFFTGDGGTLCFDCVRSEYANVSDSIRTGCNDGWNVEGLFVLYDGESVDDHCCDHCNKTLATGREG